MSGRRSDKKTFGEPVQYTPGGKTVTHGGSGNAYANYNCRCEPCTDANTARNDRRRRERYEYVKRQALKRASARIDSSGTPEARLDAILDLSDLFAGVLPDGVAHGASAYTNWGCRCDVCSAEHSSKAKKD